MTALSKYDRLEATGLWRANPEEQRREVVVSIGDATLVISNLNDQAITHWSLAAIERANSKNTPAIFHPDGDPGETLELMDSELEMIEAVDTLRRAVLKTRPRPGRLRWMGAFVSISAVAAALFFWLPGALKNHTLSVVPQVTRAKIGDQLLTRISRVAGQQCQTTAAAPALDTLALRTGVEEVIILRAAMRDSLHLPGGKILLNKSLVEDYEAPDVAAGYILAEGVRASQKDSLSDLLDVAGMRASFTLLTTGSLPASALDAYAETILARPNAPVQSQPLLAAFASAKIRSTPYARALDLTGEGTLNLIEADPVKLADSKALLRDADWLRLQAICGG